MNKIAIICLLPEEVNRYYRELRGKIAEKFGLKLNNDVPAHITLKYGFPVNDISEIEKVAEKISLSRVKAEWHLHDFGFFDNPDKYVIFIDAIPSTDTRTLHAALLDELRKIQWIQWSQFDTSALHYHVSLASEGITPKNFNDVWSYINELEKPRFEVQLDNLALFRIEKDPPFVQSMVRFLD